MSLPKMTTAVDNISKLDTRPNAVNGLTADELKAKFDKAPEDIKRFLNEVLIPALDGAITLDALGAVPETRKVNGKPLDADVTLGAADIGYAGTIPDAANVKAALDALAARGAVLIVNAQQSSSNTITADKTYAEISAEVSKKKPVACFLRTYPLGTVVLWLENFSAESAVFRLTYVTSGNYTQTAKLKVTSEDIWSLETLKETPDGIGAVPKSRTVNGKELSADITLASKDIGYSGTIGETTVANVKAALDALAVGTPLDMTDDYVASGAISVEQWATMAKVVNGVASTTEYRVAPGRYYIRSEDNIPNGWIVDIIASWDTTFRAVIAIGGGSEPCPLFIATVTDTVGSSGFPQFGISIYGDDTGEVKWGGEDYYLVPISRRDDNGKFLKCIDFGYPMEWVDLPMATASAAGVVKADAKTEDDTVPARIDTDGKLWVKGPVFLVTATSSNWDTGTADKTAVEIKDAIDAGSSVVMKLTVFGRDYYLSLAQDLSDIDVMTYAFSCIALDETGTAQMNLGAVVAMNGVVLIRKVILPWVNSSDAGKFLTVGADGTYALTELPKYDGGIS